MARAASMVVGAFLAQSLVGGTGCAHSPGQRAAAAGSPPNGCILSGDEVVFVFDQAAYQRAFPDRLPGEVRSVRLAGDFNHFDAGRPGWALAARGDGTWTLRVPASAVEDGQKYVYVANGEGLPPLPSVDRRFLLPTDGDTGVLIVKGEPVNPWLARMDDASYSDAGGRTLPYRLLEPQPYDPARKYPLVLFLHGSGERGSDNQIQVRIRNGAYELMETARSRAYFLLVPQAPKGARWDGVSDLVLGALEDVRRRYAIDGSRIYVAGLSLGGYGTWLLIGQRPDLFAAAVPVCGGGDPSTAAAMKGVAVWAFHGRRDPWVPVQESRNMVAALEAAGGDVRYTEYEDGDHFVWGRTFGDPAVIEWLFSRSKGEPSGP